MRICATQWEASRAKACQPPVNHRPMCFQDKTVEMRWCRTEEYSQDKNTYIDVVMHTKRTVVYSQKIIISQRALKIKLWNCKSIFNVPSNIAPLQCTEVLIYIKDICEHFQGEGEIVFWDCVYWQFVCFIIWFFYISYQDTFTILHYYPIFSSITLSVGSYFGCSPSLLCSESKWAMFSDVDDFCKCWKLKYIQVSLHFTSLTSQKSISICQQYILEVFVSVFFSLTD